MRIIAGKARNMRIECPPGEAVRPMLERVREAVFNLFRDAVEGADALDLFSGCGSIGIEALSRGAAWCVFVERDSKIRWGLERNLAHVRLAEFCDVIEGDACKCVPRLQRLGRRYKLVFVDPPYEMWQDADGRRRILQMLDSLADERLLTESPWITIHHMPDTPAPEETQRLRLDEQRRYGRSLISIYTLRHDRESETRPEPSED